MRVETISGINNFVCVNGEEQPCKPAVVKQQANRCATQEIFLYAGHWWRRQAGFAKPLFRMV
jgi:hypothetical protein